MFRYGAVTFDAELERLFALVGQDPRQIPVSSPESVLIAEVRPTDFDAQGRPILRRSSLVSPRAYEGRFSELLSASYAWINLSYVGLLDHNALVLVECPRGQEVRSTTRTSINLSGPSKATETTNWDARPHIVLRAD